MTFLHFIYLLPFKGQTFAEIHLSLYLNLQTFEHIFVFAFLLTFLIAFEDDWFTLTFKNLGFVYVLGFLLVVFTEQMFRFRARR